MLRPARGFTLVELLVALALGVSLLAVLLHLFVTLSETNARLLRRQQLHAALQDLMALMARDLRRAGFTTLAAPGTPFAGPLTRGPHCILYRYDMDGDGRLDPDERAGFKLEDGALLAKRSDRDCGTTPCAGCATGRWWRLNDPERVRITGLRFQETSRMLPGNGGRLRGVEIILQGTLRRFPQERQTLRTFLLPPNNLTPP